MAGRGVRNLDPMRPPRRWRSQSPRERGDVEHPDVIGARAFAVTFFGVEASIFGSMVMMRSSSRQRISSASLRLRAPLRAKDALIAYFKRLQRRSW